MERVSLPQNIDQRLAAIRSKMQTLAPAALQQDRAALKQIESLEAEQASIRRHATLEELAATESKRLAAQAEAEAAKQERQRRVEAAQQQAQIIVASSKTIDDLYEKLRLAFESRGRAIRALAATRVVSVYSTNRMLSKFNATSSARHHQLHNWISCEAILLAHIKSLTAADAWLSQPLTLTDELTPDEMEFSNGERLSES